MGLVGTVGNIDKVSVGGVEFVDIANLICVGAEVTAAGVGARYTTARAPFATSGYPVSGGKTFRILCIRYVMELPSASTGSGCDWGYSTADAGIDNAASPAGYTSAGNAGNMFAPRNMAASSTLFVQGKFEVPTGKYITALEDGCNAGFHFYGYEV